MHNTQNACYIHKKKFHLLCNKLNKRNKNKKAEYTTYYG